MNNFFKQLGWKVALKISQYVLFAIAEALFSLVTPGFLGKFFPAIADYRWEISIMLFCLLAGCTIMLYFRFNKYVPNFPRIDFDYAFLKREINYRYISRQQIEQTISTQFKALKNSIDFYPGRFSWSGGDYKLISNKKEHQIVMLPRKHNYDEYQVKFDRILKRKDIIETELVWKLDDPNATALPCITCRITVPCDLLKIVVEIPRELGVKKVHCEEAYIDAFIYPEKHFEEQLDPLTGRYTWEISKPKLFFNYKISWYF